MAISVIELGAALRLSDGLTAPPEPYASMLARYISVAEEFIGLESPGAPDPIKREAVVRMAGYCFDSPPRISWRNFRQRMEEFRSSVVGSEVESRPGDDVKLWPFNRNEQRDVSATDQLVNALVRQAGGESGSRKTAVAEAVVGLWGRAFSVATVEPAGFISEALDARTLNSLGRSLAQRGRWVAEIVVGGDTGLSLDVADSWTVHGTGPSSTWTYELSFARPSATVTRQLEADRVVDVVLDGGGPLCASADTVGVISNVDNRLAQETDTPTGYLLPVPAGQKDALSTDLKNLKGKLGIVETTSSWAADSKSAPQEDYVPKRVGSSPPTGIYLLRDSLEKSVFRRGWHADFDLVNRWGCTERNASPPDAHDYFPRCGNSSC